MIHPMHTFRALIALTLLVGVASCQASDSAGAADVPGKPRAVGATTNPVTAESLYNALQRTVPEVRFDNIGFADVVEFFRDLSAQNIVVNWRALEAAGIDRNAPVSLRLRNVSLEQAIRHAARDVGGGTVTLGFTIDSGAIVVSTMEDLARYPRPRVYPVADLLPDVSPSSESTTRPATSLDALITECVAPSSWRTAGGTIGSISVVGDSLVITTLDMYHLDIDRLLAELRRHK